MHFGFRSFGAVIPRASSKAESVVEVTSEEDDDVVASVL